MARQVQAVLQKAMRSCRTSSLLLVHETMELDEDDKKCSSAGPKIGVSSSQPFQEG